MKSLLNEFPLSGELCSLVLLELFEVDQTWKVFDIETLTNDSSSRMGEFYRLVQSSKEVVITTHELCKLLGLATQIIVLDIRLESQDTIKLVVEDGEVVECSLVEN